jgi:translation initiation factor 1A
MYNTSINIFYKMPNLKGGKKYKAGKHAEKESVLHEIGEGQTIGRVIRVLGNRNMLVYCNDGRERIAHIRGGLRKKNACIELGDIILFSLRGEGMNLSSDSNGNTKERGDILAKYDREVFSQLKKIPGVNLNLFKTIETMDSRQKISTNLEEDDFGFTFEQNEESDEDDDGDDIGKEERSKAREARKMALDKKRIEDRSKKLEGGRDRPDDDEINIDAI